MTNRIVTINVSQTNAPKPSTLQQSGAAISMGGTTAATGSLTLYSSLAAVTAAISGAGNYVEVLAMATTYFAQPNAVGLYILEFGTGTVDATVAALGAWIIANPGIIYSFLIPASWDDDAAFLTLLASYTALNAKTYFWVTTTLANFHVYANLKCVVTFVPASTAPSTEFGCAAPFAVALAYAPSSTNLMTPLAFSYLYGVTVYDGTVANQTTLHTGNANYVGTGAEGGISNTILYWGHTMDGLPFNYWYSADWAQINLDLNLSNEVINGSNNPINPLLYNQTGINRLQGVARKTVTNAVSYALANGNVKTTSLPVAQFLANFNAGLYAGLNVVNAEPYGAYTSENPSDYAIGKYGGLTVIYIPQRGFEQIVVNLNITDIVS